MYIRFNVPAECVPSLIGLKGDKKRDTELKTDTQIRFIRQSEELYIVSITGEEKKCYQAKKIILLSVAHHRASILTFKYTPKQPNEKEVASDLKTFWAEVCQHKL